MDSLKMMTLVMDFFVVGFIAIMLLLRNSISLLDDPFSRIGNQPEAYLIFVIGIVAVLFNIGTIMYRLNKGRDWKIVFVVFFGTIAALVPYNDHDIISKDIHTWLAIVSAFILITLILQVGKKLDYKEKMIRKTILIIPYVTFAGTLGIFLLSSLNGIMQLFYIVGIMAWLNLTIFFKDVSLVGND